MLSYILSERQNVREFRKEFALTDAEVQRVLALVREENEALATELARSEIIVEKNEGLPEKRIAEKITASDYDETVRGSLAATKDAVQEISCAKATGRSCRRGWTGSGARRSRPRRRRAPRG